MANQAEIYCTHRVQCFATEMSLSMAHIRAASIPRLEKDKVTDIASEMCKTMFPNVSIYGL